MQVEDLKKQLQNIIDHLENGCGRQGCRIKRPTGQAPNGPCRCGMVALSTELYWLGNEILEISLEYSK